MIVFDCEIMIHPNTGLNSFCANLGRSLLKEASDIGQEMSFMVRKPQSGYFGDGCSYIVYKSMYRYFDVLRMSRKECCLWHSAFQFPKVLPKGVPTVMTVHDLNFMYTDTGREQAKRRRRMQKAIDKASAVVAISEYTKRDLERFMNLEGKNVHVIYNGCNRYSGLILPPSYKPGHEFLFTVGTLFPKKNFHVLPWLLQGNSYELVIAGIRTAYEKRILEEAAAAGVSDRVHVAGEVDEAAKHWYLENCSAFVFPSLAEGFGLPVLEAMYYGKPVFLSTRTSLPEIGGDKAFYFSDMSSPEIMQADFAEGMKKFREGAVSPDSIRRHAEMFSWDAAAKAYCNLYRQVLRSRC